MTQERKPILDSQERASEVLFGLIMVLSFTGSLSAAQAGREDVRTMLIGAVGCNLAWGIVDAVMYVMSVLHERVRGAHLIRLVRRARTPEAAHQHILEALPAEFASALGPAEVEGLRTRIVGLPEVAVAVPLRREDLWGALGVFLLVFLSTLPVTIPFLVMQDALLALRVSNGIAIVMLFLTGYAAAKPYVGRPWRMGLAMVAIGLVLVAITIALGG